MADLFSLDQLRTLITIVDTGSFTAAAERLYKTQPALSMQMKNLEDQVGARLLERSGRETTVTEAGRILLGYARRILDMNEEALAKLSVSDAAGSVRIGVLEEAALGPLVHALTRFGRLCTNIQIQLEVSTSWELVRKIESNALCLAVANMAYSNGPVEPLWQERYLWVCADTYEREPGAPLQLIMDPLDCSCCVRDEALERLAGREIEWKVAFSSISLPALQAAVHAELGIGLLSESAVTPNMRVLGADDGLPDVPPAEIGLYRSGESSSEAADLLHEFLLEHLRTGAAALKA